jgi:hypothetical protein
MFRQTRSTELARALGLFAVAIILGMMMASPPDPYEVTAVGWAIFGLFELGFVVAAIRMIRLEAIDPGGDVYVFRTRELSLFVELVLTFFGFLGLLMIAQGWIEAFGMRYVAPGPAWHERDKTLGTILMTVCGLAIGFPAIFYRPAFILDVKAGTLYRYPFGLTLPIRMQEMQPAIEVVAEGYYTGKPKRRVGDMIRGRTPAGSFELELVLGNVPEEEMARRLDEWRSTLDRLNAR